MFRDAKEELQRLEQELLEIEVQEQEEQQELEEKQELEEQQEQEEQQEPEWEDLSFEEEESYVNPPENFRAYNTDQTDVDLEEFSRQILKPEESLTGWIALALFLMAGIVCVLGYWVLRILGVLG